MVGKEIFNKKWIEQARAAASRCIEDADSVLAALDELERKGISEADEHEALSNLCWGVICLREDLDHTFFREESSKAHEFLKENNMY